MVRAFTECTITGMHAVVYFDQKQPISRDRLKTAISDMSQLWINISNMPNFFIVINAIYSEDCFGDLPHV